MGHPDRPVFDLDRRLAGWASRDGRPGGGGERRIGLGRRRLPGHPHLPLRIARGVQPGGARGDGRRPRGRRAGAVGQPWPICARGGSTPRRLARAHKRLRVEWAEFLDNPQELAFLVGHHYAMNHWSVLPDLIEARGRGNGGRRAAGRSEVLRALQPGDRHGPGRAPRGERAKLVGLCGPAGRTAMRFWMPTPRMVHGHGNADLRSARADRRPAHDASPLSRHETQARERRPPVGTRGPKASARRIAALPHETQARERRPPVGTRGPKASARRIAALPHETQARERRPPVGTRGPKASARRVAALPHETQARERRPPVGTRGPKASARRIAALPHETQARERRPLASLPVGAGTRGLEGQRTSGDTSCALASRARACRPEVGVPVPASREAEQRGVVRWPSARACRPEVGVPVPASREAERRGVVRWPSARACRPEVGVPVPASREAERRCVVRWPSARACRPEVGVPVPASREAERRRVVRWPSARACRPEVGVPWPASREAEQRGVVRWPSARACRPEVGVPWPASREAEQRGVVRWPSARACRPEVGVPWPASREAERRRVVRWPSARACRPEVGVPVPVRHPRCRHPEPHRPSPGRSTKSSQLGPLPSGGSARAVAITRLEGTK